MYPVFNNDLSKKLHSADGYTALRYIIDGNNENQLRINENGDAALIRKEAGNWKYYKLLSQLDMQLSWGTLTQGTMSTEYSTICIMPGIKHGQLNVTGECPSVSAWGQTLLMTSQIKPTVDIVFTVSSQDNAKSYDCVFNTKGEIILFTRQTELSGTWIRGGCVFI